MLSFIAVATFTLAAHAGPAPFLKSREAKVRRPKQVELLTHWVASSDQLTLAKLKKFTDWAALDSESDAIVKTAMARFGAKDLSAFLKLFVLVDPDSRSEEGTGNRRGGSTSHGTLNTDTLDLDAADWFSSERLEEREPYRTRIEELSRKYGAYLTLVSNRGIQLHVSFLTGPRIFLAAGQPMRESYESFLHELTHFIRFDLSTEPDPLKFDNEDDYESAFLLSPGQEVDARISGIQGLIRLLRQLPDYTSLPVDTASWFDSNGKVRVSEATELTVIRDFLGYNARGTWKNRLEVREADDDQEFRALTRACPSDERCRSRMDVLQGELKRAGELLKTL